MALAPAVLAAPKSIAGSIGAATPGISGGLFNSPRGVAVNQIGSGGVPAGTAYVGDGNSNRVQRISPTGGFVAAWGWDVVKNGTPSDPGNVTGFQICSVAADCKNGIGGAGAGQFGGGGIEGIAVDQARGVVYVADQADRRIDAFSPAGTFEGAFGFGTVNGAAAFQFCTTVCGVGSAAGGDAGRFGGEIGGLAVDGAGNIYVADKTNRRIDVFAPVFTGSVVSGVSFTRAFGWKVDKTSPAEEFQVCTTASGCQAGTGGPGKGQFASSKSPSDVAVDSEGNVFALDNNTTKRVQEFSAVPVPITQEFGAAALGAVFESGELQSIAIDSSTTPNHILVAGKRSGSAPAGRLAVVELDHAGANALGAGNAHGTDLTVTSANGFGVAPASLGGNLYLSTATTGTLQGVYVLNEVPTIEPVTVHAGTTATFKGAVVSNEFDVEYHFETSTDGTVWSSLPSEAAAAASGTVPVEAQASHLTGSQHYHVRLVQNRPLGGGSAVSAETTFDTDAAAPEILATSATAVSATGAKLMAELNSENSATTYSFEYVDDAAFQTGEYANATSVPVPAANLSPGSAFVPVSRVISGLQPGTTYHFRLVAGNGNGTTEGETGQDRTFSTYPAPLTGLPDGRAYELVSPSDTNGLTPTGTTLEANPEGGLFDSPLGSPNGENVLFYTYGGALPGLGGVGINDRYEAVRGSAGWLTRYAGPSGAQTEIPQFGSSSSDHGYAFLDVGASEIDNGPFAHCERHCSYLRHPDGSFTATGEGSLGEEPEALGMFIAKGGAHVLFWAANQGFHEAVQLEPDAAPTGTAALYDRTPDGVTHVVSLAPGNIPFAAGEEAFPRGVSTDGTAVAFSVGGTMYLRRGNAETLTIAEGEPTFAGLSQNGDRVFYMQGALSNEEVTEGELFSCATDAGSCAGPDAVQAPTPIGSGSESVVVNIAEDGSRLYFVSPLVLDAGANAAGEEAEVGSENLYVWSASSPGAVRFVADLDESDVLGELAGGQQHFDGLGLWTRNIEPISGGVLFGLANDPSRTSPDGSALVFRSRADLTPYENDGHAEIYRYDVGDDEVRCLSCNPSNIAATADADLEDPTGNFPREDSNGNLTQSPLIAHDQIANVTSDGRKVFFESGEALVPGDGNGTGDVYEWEDEGVGGCGRPQGCIHLISSGLSSRPSYLYGMTPDGHDVFFWTADALVARDHNDGVPAIYDAREGGGFVEAGEPPPCQGDSCQGPARPAPGLAAPASVASPGSGNLKQGHAHRKHRKRSHRGKHRRRGAHRSRGAAR